MDFATQGRFKKMKGKKHKKVTPTLFEIFNFFETFLDICLLGKIFYKVFF